MANRNFPSAGKIYSNHTMPVAVDVAITIGATGAVSSIASANSFVKSVVRTGTGLYTINLADPYQSLLMAVGSAISPVSGLSGVDSVETQNAPNSTITSLSAPSIGIKTLSPAGALVDPASGSTVTVLMYLSNSSLG